MAIRMIRKKDDELLRKTSREVKKITPSLWTLLEDMADTMRENNGVGLAAPQVGVLKRVIVIDIGEGLIELINPEIIDAEGEQIGGEGCLSVPGTTGYVNRPQKVIVRGLDRNGKEIEITGEDYLAVALCHEIDHLDGILFIDKESFEEIVEADKEGGEVEV